MRRPLRVNFREWHVRWWFVDHHYYEIISHSLHLTQGTKSSSAYLNEIPPRFAKETHFLPNPLQHQLPVALWVINRRLGNTSAWRAASVSVQESRLVTNELLEWNIRTWTGIVIQNVVPSLIFPSYSNSGSIHLLHLLRRLIVVSWMDGQPYHSFSYWVWGCDRMEMLWNVLLSVFHCLASSGPC